MLVIGLFAFAGVCAHAQIADNPSPTASLEDSFTPNDDGSTDFFFAAEIDGERVTNAPERSRRDLGITHVFLPGPWSRPVPVKQLAVEVRGRRHPEHESLFSSDQPEITGVITFTPKANHRYAIMGKLDIEHSTIWIQDTDDGTLMGAKIESDTMKK